jgi:hypothetical protein
MVCPQCGATSDEGQRFCYNCGARLDSQQPTLVASPQGSQAIPPPPAPIEPAGYQQAGYQQTAAAGYAPMAIPNSNLAIISLVAGIISWVLLPVIGALAAVITGHMARREIRDSGGRVGGDGLALIGLVLGYANLALLALGICAFFGFFVLAVASS